MSTDTFARKANGDPIVDAGLNSISAVPMSGIAAGANYLSAWIDASECLSGSFQFKWTSLTGSVDATVKIEGTNDGGTTVDDATSGATFTLSGANGHNTISLVGTITHTQVRVNYAHVSVTGGTVDCNARLKG